MRSPWRSVVIALVCGLTLAASGDDICLVRMVAPGLFAKCLCLDDPNEDFTASARALETFDAPSQGQAGDVSPILLLTLMAPAPSPVLLAPGADFPHPRDLLVTPLRC